jgi:hypothetical protein
MYLFLRVTDLGEATLIYLGYSPWLVAGLKHRQYTPFKRRMSEVGCYPCRGVTHGYRFNSER